MVNYKKFEDIAREEEAKENREIVEENKYRFLNYSGDERDDDGELLPKKLVSQYDLSNTESKFVQICKPKAESVDNVSNYQSIIDILTLYPEIINTDVVVNHLLKATEIASEKGDDCAMDLMNAVNTIEACRIHGTIALFAKISTPKDEETKALRLKYARREFGKERLLRYTLGEEDYVRIVKSIQSGEENNELWHSIFKNCFIFVATIIIAGLILFLTIYNSP